MIAQSDLVEEYGVCACERATLLNQRWGLKDVEVLTSEGTWTSLWYVYCALCNRRYGWWWETGAPARPPLSP